MPRNPRPTNTMSGRELAVFGRFCRVCNSIGVVVAGGVVLGAEVTGISFGVVAAGGVVLGAAVTGISFSSGVTAMIGTVFNSSGVATSAASAGTGALVTFAST